MANAYSFKVNASGNAVGEVSKIRSSVQGLASEMRGLATAALGIGSLFAGFSFLKSSLESFNKFEASTVNLKSTIASTGGAAGISFGQFKEDADKLGKIVLFPKSSIVEAESMLAMFTSIHGQMMDKTLPVAADLATKFGMDIPQAAKLLGRSLENLQLGRLQMQLGKMSDAQLLQIKHFKEIGQTANAQAVILDFVRAKVGGLSEAMAQTDSGKLQMAAKTLTELKLSVGKLVSELLVGLIPAFNAIVKDAKEFKDWVTGDTTGAEIFRDVVVALAGAIILYTTYTTLATAAQWLFNAALWASGIPELILMVVGLAAAYMYLWDKVKVFREGIGGVFAFMAKWYRGLIDFTIDLAKVLSDLFTGNFKMAIKEGKLLFTDFKKDFITGWGVTVKEGAEKAANSSFKFSNLLGIGGKGGTNLGTASLGTNMALMAMGMIGMGNKPGTPEGGETGRAALNTSLLGGASGGLGEAKTIKIDFHSPLMAINVPGGNGQDIINKAPLTMEMLLRILNNMSLSQGSM